MILFKGIDLDRSFLFPFDQVLDSVSILVPISALFATFLKLDQHLMRSLVILNSHYVTFMQSKQILILYLISTSLHSSSNSSESSIKCFYLSLIFSTLNNSKVLLNSLKATWYSPIKRYMLAFNWCISLSLKILHSYSVLVERILSSC